MHLANVTTKNHRCKICSLKQKKQKRSTNGKDENQFTNKTNKIEKNRKMIALSNKQIRHKFDAMTENQECYLVKVLIQKHILPRS